MMEASIDMFDAVCNPTAVYTPILGWDEDLVQDSTNWQTSNLNPKNRINTLTLPSEFRWRLDGIDVDGTRFFAVPLFALKTPPLRIDVYIPSQSEHGLVLREALQSGSAMVWTGIGAQDLALSKHILHALDLWSSEFPDFEKQYNELPFGSRIIIDNMCADIRQMEIYLVPVYDVEQQWYSLKNLQDMWKFPSHDWPEVLDLSELKLQYQHHEAITIVEIPKRHGAQNFIFKSLVRDSKYLYHELKMLLTLDPHPNVISRPLYVVTKKCRFGGKIGICGFVLKYYPHGTLRNELWKSASATIPPISLSDQFCWARDVTQAVIHINNSALGFYPDIKPDNVVLSAENGVLRAVLIDLEQRGGWYSWSPPEVAYIEYLEYIATRSNDYAVAEKHKKLLRSFIQSWKPLTQGDRYHDSEHGFSSAWVSLSRSEREAAQVFMLGKLMWCIFECSSSVNCALGVDMFHEQDTRLRFPTFQSTPAEMQSLIQSCTAGAAEWRGKYRPLVISGTKLFPVKEHGQIELKVGNAHETQLAAKEWWCEEVNDAVAFLEGKVKRLANYDDCGAIFHEVTSSASQRPSLQHVLATIEKVGKPFRSDPT
ncbi:hypothetical protein B0J14DRAFT_700453 [Halenospora varia]|nr:hypothetical protein B0J14DRAFT_700453 [Halenospora varia]